MAKTMTFKQLRESLAALTPVTDVLLDDDAEVIVRIMKDDGTTMVGGLVTVSVEAGCTDDDALVLDADPGAESDAMGDPPKKPSDYDQSKVYWRDASFHASSHAGGKTLRCHFPHPDDECMAACSPRSIMLHEGSEDDPIKVSEESRCQKPACKARYDAADVAAGKKITGRVPKAPDRRERDGTDRRAVKRRTGDKLAARLPRTGERR